MNTTNNIQKHRTGIFPALFTGIFLIMINVCSLQANEYEQQGMENSYNFSGSRTSVFDDSFSDYSPYMQDLSEDPILRAGSTEGGGHQTKMTPAGNGFLFLILLSGIYSLIYRSKRLKNKNRD